MILSFVFMGRSKVHLSYLMNPRGSSERVDRLTDEVATPRDRAATARRQGVIPPASGIRSPNSTRLHLFSERLRAQLPRSTGHCHPRTYQVVLEPAFRISPSTARYGGIETQAAGPGAGAIRASQRCHAVATIAMGRPPFGGSRLRGA